MPRILEYALGVIDLVSEELEVSRDVILSKCRTAEAVDARHLTVRLLLARGIYPSRIASILGMSPRSVHYIITTFDVRLQANKSLRNIYAKITKQLGNNCEATMI